MYQNPLAGRMSRLHFIYSQLLLLGLIIPICIFIFINGINIHNINKLLSVLVPLTVLSFPLQVILAVRRLHDLNISGLWSFLIAVPYISLLFMLYISTKTGDVHANRYGHPDNRRLFDSLLNKI